MDGFFSGFRREVGRRPFNTTGPTVDIHARMRQLMRELVRSYQWKYWFAGNDLFQLFGAFREAERVLPGSAGWDTADRFFTNNEQDDAPVLAVPAPGPPAPAVGMAAAPAPAAAAPAPAPAGPDVNLQAALANAALPPAAIAALQALAAAFQPNA